MRTLAQILSVWFCFGLTNSSVAVGLDHFQLLDLKVGKQRLTGRVMAFNDQTCWLLQRDGRLNEIATAHVSEFAERKQQFQAYSPSDMKSSLQSEFGKNFDVRSAGQYVVVARRGTSNDYATHFDQIYREFVRAFRSRGLELATPEFPLVAIVFPDRASFVKHCQAKRVPVSAELAGYYFPVSNRVIMYERPDRQELDSVVIHEAIHQAAYNTGLHLRLADHPKWVVEGLSTVFEADGMRSRNGTSSAVDRVNRERFLWFQEYAQSRRAPGTLKRFIADNDVFESAKLDAYSEAWAVSFFLVETRPADYSRYLKRMVARDPLQQYDASARLKDFADTFGSDLDVIETAMLRFIRRLGSR